MVLQGTTKQARGKPRFRGLWTTRTPCVERNSRGRSCSSTCACRSRWWSAYLLRSSAHRQAFQAVLRGALLVVCAIARGAADLSRTGCVPASLPRNPSLQWTYTPLHPPAPAWPDPGKEWHRLAFDHANHVALTGGLAVYGSSADHHVRALDLESGRERWCFSTQGPVRFGPAAADGRLFVPSDDGILYCLDAATGAELWRFRGAPENAWLIGNEQMISRWPMRSSALVHDGVVYCTAGMWSTEGVFVYALRADDGTVLWVNDSSAQVYQKMPHDNAESIAGLSPQGYLLLHDGVLVVPTGRSTPVAFDAASGRRLYMRTNFTKRHHPGGAWLLATRGLVFGERRVPRMIRVLPGPKGPSGSEGLIAWDCRTGTEMLALFGKHRAATDGSRLFLAGSGSLWCCDLDAFLARADEIRENNLRGTPKETFEVRSPAHDPASPWSRVHVHPEQLSTYRPTAVWETELPLTYTLLLTADTIVAGCDDRLLGFDAASGEQRWDLPVDGPVRALNAIDGYLIAGTTSGRIYCFGSAAPAAPTRVAPAAVPVANATEATDLAAAILHQSAVDAGYGLIMGSRTADLAAALARNSRLTLYVPATGGDTAAAMRRQLTAAGLYGTRIAIHDAEPVPPQYPAYAGNLVVVDARRGQDGSGVDLAAAYRCVRPHGGVLCILPGDQPASVWHERLVAADVPATDMAAHGDLLLLRRGALSGEGVWTHKYADAGRSSASTERNLRFPLRMLWFGSIGPAPMTDRHWQGSPPLYSNGRMFLQGTYDVMAVDAYNGRLLWQRHFPELRRVGFRFRGGSIVTDGRFVYALLGTHCHQLDAATGETAAIHPAPISTEVLDAMAKEFEFVYFPPRLKVWQSQLERAETWRREGYDPELISSPVLYPMNNDPVWEFLAVTEDLIIGSVGVPHPVIQHTAYAVPECPYVFAVDKADGEVRWVYRADEAVDPEAMAIQGNRLYLLDRTSPARQARGRRRGIDVPLRNRLRAIDLATGSVVWDRASPLPGGTRLWSSPKALVLTDKPRIAVLSLPEGEELWRRDTIWYSSKGGWHIYPNIVDDTLYVNPFFYDLTTGEQHTMAHPLSGEATPVKVGFRYGCGVNSLCPAGAFFRGGSSGMFDRVGLSGTHWLGNVRSGCWQNIIPAGGLLLMPESASGCTCPYNYQTSVAMIAGRTHENWSAVSANAAPRIRRAAINVGAPGDQRAPGSDGVLWLAFPRAHRPDDALQLPLLAWGQNPRFVHRHADLVPIAGSVMPWLYTSRLENVRRLTLDLDPDRPAVCPATETAPVLDGTLDDACWDGRQPITLRGSDQIAAADIDLFLRHDTEHLYIGYRRRAPLRNGRPVPWTAEARGDHSRVFMDDSFNVRFWRTRRGAWIGLSASGAMFAVTSTPDGPAVRMQRLTGFRKAVNTTPAQWSAEIAIPWQLLERLDLCSSQHDDLAIHVESRNHTGVGPERVFYRYRLEERNEGGGMRNTLFGRTRVALQPPPPGSEQSYTVKLHFAETETVAPGQRVFTIRIQDQTVAEQIDIASLAGIRNALVRAYHGIRARDRIEITLVPAPDSVLPPSICALEVREE